MKIAVIGTGMVGRILAAKLSTLGHEVMVGTRDVQATLARTETGSMGTAPFAEWQADHPDVRLATLAEAGAFADVVLNASNGANSLKALEAVGSGNLADKVLIDLALPLDLSQGMPPTLTVANSDSLGEQIQRTFPRARVVKTLTSVFCEVMVDPDRIPGEHVLFLAGDDQDAKQTALGILGEFGWPADRVIDLGDITASRATEMYSRLFFTLVGALGGNFAININVVRGK